MANNNQNLPTWIEAKLFENILQKTVDGFKEILDFKVFPALAPGENYGTLMLKIKIEVLLETGATYMESFMLKHPLDSDFQRHVLAPLKMFALETCMYGEIIPEFEKLYMDAGLKVEFGAKGYKLPTEKDYILLEDLSKRGFKNVKRQDGVNLEHCKSVLKKMAQWHAASAVRVDRNGHLEEKFLKGFLNEDSSDLCKLMFGGTLESLLPSIKKLKGSEEYYEKLTTLSTKVIDELFSRNTLDLNEFIVLNHCDLWSNNIMFQYDEAGKLNETYFVDFQLPRYGAPAQDLYYFLVSSTQLDYKIEQFDYLIKYYHDNLVEHLALLKYSKSLPALRDIHSMLYKYDIWGVVAATSTLVGVLVDSSDAASFDNLVGDSEEGEKFRQLLFSNERLLKQLEVLLPWLNKRGALDS